MHPQELGVMGEGDKFEVKILMPYNNQNHKRR